jgi:hypothetical protein
LLRTLLNHVFARGEARENPRSPRYSGAVTGKIILDAEGKIQFGVFPLFALFTPDFSDEIVVNFHLILTQFSR